MNYHRLPPAPRTSLPAFIEPARGLEPLYKAEGGQGGAEASAAQLRAMFFKCLHLVLKYKLLFAFFCCVSLLIGLVMTLLTPKIYSAATTVKIDRVVPRILNTQMSGQAESSFDPGSWQTQLLLIKSKSLAERVATALNLAQTDFVGAGPPSLWSRITRRDAPKKVDAATLQARQAQAVGNPLTDPPKSDPCRPSARS